MKYVISLLFFLAAYNPAFAVSGGRWLQTTVTVTGTASKVLEERIGRQYLLVVNKGSVTIYLKVDAAPGANEGIPIPAGGNYEITYPPYNTVWLKAASGSQIVEITEG